MSAQDWPRLEDLFHRAAALPPSKRATFLDAECAGDPALRAELESLLGHDAPPGTGLEDAIQQEAEVMADDQWLIGRRIGAYRIAGVIGEGGMGAVYEAVRDDDQYQKRVAVKLVRHGLETEAVLRRFRAERQILASLDHPYIARLLDGGATTDGLPYLVMELIEGVPITKYVNEHKLPVAARVRLFQKVCDAVQHAHQSLVVHRDLKPANIMVTAEGVPKLLDFGIAKLLNPSDEDSTVTRIAPWTPDYASPEQVRSRPVTTRTDVYSLGLILFELLTGERAQIVEGTSPAAMERSICETAIPWASTKAPHLVARQLAGDLDTIVAKATQKDPERRYASAAEFAEDLGRYLDGRPVRARKDSAAYRTSKFVRRNWLPVGAAAVAVLGLAGGAIGFAWQARVANRSRVVAERHRIAAEQQRDRAEREHQVAEQQRDSARREQARAENLASEANTQRERANSEAATAKAVSDFLHKDLLAQASAANQSKPDTKPDPDLKVRTALDRAAARIQGKFDKQPLVEAAIRHTTGDAYRDLGLLAEAQVHLQRALELRREALGDEHPDTLRTLESIGQLYWDQGKHAEQEALEKKLLEVQRRVLGAEHPETLQTMTNLAALANAQGKSEEAATLFRTVLNAQRRVLGEQDVQTLVTMDDLANAYADEGKYALAGPLWKAVIESRTRLLGPEHPNTVASMNNLAALLAQEGKYDSAEELFIKVLEVDRRVLGEEHPGTLVCMNNLAKVQSDQGKYETAESLYTRVLAVRRRVLGATHPSTLLAMNTLGLVYRNEGRFAEAEALHNQILETGRATLGEDHRAALYARHYLGMLYQRQGRYAEAEAMFSKLVETRRRVIGATHPDTSRTLVSLGEVRVQQRKFVEAESPLREALGNFEKTKFDGWNRYQSQTLLGAALAGQNRFAEAEPSLLAGYDALVQRRATIPVESRAVVDQTGAWIVELYQNWGKPDKAAEWRTKIQGGRP